MKRVTGHVAGSITIHHDVETEVADTATPAEIEKALRKEAQPLFNTDVCLSNGLRLHMTVDEIDVGKCQHHHFKMTIMEEKYEDFIMIVKPDGEVEIEDVDDDAEPDLTEKISVSCLSSTCNWAEDYTELLAAPLFVQRAYYKIYHDVEKVTVKRT